MMLRTTVITVLALLAFAGNALLGRMALGDGLIDPASFTTLRVLSGALTLWLLMLPRWRSRSRAPTNWRTVAMLFAYMVFYSFAYVSLDAGTGAIVGFAATQLTMFAAALRMGERFSTLAWSGLAIAIGGVVYLLLPGVSTPDPLGALWMAVAGCAWGFYSVIGSGEQDSGEATANNFIGALPLAIGVQVAFLSSIHVTGMGVALAIVSGSVTSGLGYILWYAALRQTGVSIAATAQLSVPIIIAAGGALLLDEAMSPRLLGATIMTLGGIVIVLRARAA